jgi:hypothetical protein
MNKILRNNNKRVKTKLKIKWKFLKFVKKTKKEKRKSMYKISILKN